MVHRPFGYSALGRAVAVVMGLSGAGAAMEPDPEIVAMIEGINAESLLEHVDLLVAFGTRRWDQPGGRATQEHIQAFFSELGLDEVSLHDFDEGSDSVLGLLRGHERPERLHVVGAHYDSTRTGDPTGLAPGADDNASGAAALLEAARAIARSNLRPSESILFVAFSGEEHQRSGSRALVADLTDQAATVVDMICLDSIGYVRPGTEPDLSVSSSSFTPEINALIEELGEVATAYLPGWVYEGGPGCG